MSYGTAKKWQKIVGLDEESRKLETVPEAARAIMSDYFRQK